MTDILLTEEVRDPSIDELAARYRLAYEPHLCRDRAALLARAVPGLPAARELARAAAL